jgi:CubicO group peptidase (beta-lactamase class C family)
MSASLPLLQTLARAWRLPGLVACAFDRRGVETLAVGERDPALSLPMGPHTVFPIASVTKTFTADLLQRAVAEGKVAPEAPLRDQLPGFALADADASRDMTPFDAAAHFSGLPPHTWAWVFGELGRADFLRERLPHLGAAGPFREKHRYSNLLYAVLGQLTEAATGESWERALSRLILEPLEMEHSAVMGADWADSPADVARPHRDAADGPRPIAPFVARAGHPIAPASEMMAGMPDLARWGQALLRLDPDDARWRPRSRIREGLHYGLGWRLDQAGKDRRVWHSGQCSGYAALLVLFPERGRGVAFAANRSGSLGALWAAMDLLETGKLPDTPVPPPPPEAPPPERAGFAPPDALPEGDYRHPGYGGLRLSRRDGRLLARFQDADPTPLRGGAGDLRYTLPIYDVTFPIAHRDGAIEIPFESALPPIRFTPAG